MKKEILVSLVSSVITSLVLILIGMGAGFFEKQITNTQLVDLADKLANEKRYRVSLLSEFDHGHIVKVGVAQDGDGNENIRGKDKDIAVTFDTPFAETPQFYVSVSGFGADQNTPVTDAYAKVIEVTPGAAVIRCTAAPYDKAYLKINWIAIGRPSRAASSPTSASNQQSN